MSPPRTRARDTLTPADLPALALVEVSSIARGVIVVDALCKKAQVTVLQTHPVSPGKHVTIFAGEVADVEEAHGAALAAAGSTLVDRLLLPYAHRQLAPLVAGASQPPPSGTHDALAVVETFTIAAALAAADAAAKAADVTLLEMRLGQGIGGKAFFTMTGELDAIEAAADAARSAVEAGLVLGIELIAAPASELRQRLFW